MHAGMTAVIIQGKEILVKTKFSSCHLITKTINVGSNPLFSSQMRFIHLQVS